MHILITGGTGFIGERFIHHFDQNQYTVLTRFEFRAKRQLPLTVKFIEDLSELINLNEFDAVINLAGEPIIDKRWTKKHKQIIYQSRWNITRQLVDLFSSSEQPPAIFLSGSAIGFYGESGDKTVTENDAVFSTDFGSEICQQWELIAQQVKHITRVVNLRTGIVLGAKNGALEKMLLPFSIGLGGNIGSGQQYMSWIHIQDMINAIDFLLKNDTASGAFNLTAPHPVTNSYFTLSLANILGKKPRLNIPEWLLRIAMGESASLLLNSQRVIPEKLLKAGFEFEFSELKIALSNLLEN